MTRRGWSWGVRGLGLLLVGLMLGSGCSSCDDEPGLTEADFFDPRDYGEYEFDREPDIDGPAQASFGYLLAGETVTRQVTLRNAGKNILEIASWYVDGPFEMAPADQRVPPIELLPEATVEVAISHTALDEQGARGVLVVESNDPDEPVFEVPLAANVDQPCLVVEPGRIDFGSRQRDRTHTESVVATNCSQRAPVRFEAQWAPGNPAFSTDATAMRGPMELGAGESIEIAIDFRPTDPVRYGARLRFLSDDPERPDQVVEIAGEGAPFACPEAIIRASHPERGEAIADPRATLETVPLDEITLESVSVDPEGTGIARTEWALVQRPPDANAELTGTGDDTRSMWMQLAGTYVVELRVWSGLGVESCEPARMTLEAVADEDIHVQLVWDTPSDPNQADNAGTDVDLHLLHPNGQWDRSPWDCFWQNKTPNWGDRGRTDDDPSLDIDDTNGAGPENINLDNPERGLTYEVGAYYFSDHNYGSSFATVRVYLGGVLELELARRRLSDEQFWHVAQIDWSAGTVTEVDEITDWIP